jgi:hypothetical protein
MQIKLLAAIAVFSSVLLASGCNKGNLDVEAIAETSPRPSKDFEPLDLSKLVLIGVERGWEARDYGMSKEDAVSYWSNLVYSVNQ